MQQWETQADIPEQHALRGQTHDSASDKHLLRPTNSYLSLQGSPTQFPDQSNRFLTKELKKWSTTDVMRWLESKRLEKFVSVFQENKVSGKKLSEGCLHFLDKVPNINLQERESVLSAVYNLMNPDSVCVCENELKNIASLADREKYLAAVHVAQSKDSTCLQLVESRATSPCQAILTASPSTSSVSSPMIRHKDSCSSQSQLSAEDITMSLHQSQTSIQDKEAVPHTRSTSRTSITTEESYLTTVSSKEPLLFQMLSCDHRRDIHCVKLHKQSDEEFKLTVATTDQGHVLVETVDEDGLLKKNDRILEINGSYICNETDFRQSLKGVDTLNIVLVRSALLIADEGEKGIEEWKKNDVNNQVSELHNKLSDSKWKWKKLKEFLKDMKEREVDPLEIFNNIPASEMEDIKERFILKEEIRQLQEALTDSTNKIHNLQKALESKTAALHELSSEKDELTKLLDQMNRGSSDGSVSAESCEEKADWDNLSSSSKEGDLQALKERAAEASRQKAYLDRLLSAVVKHAPWLLNDIDANMENMSIMSHLEEWC